MTERPSPYNRTDTETNQAEAESDRPQFSDRLRQLREQHGLSQNALARKAGIAPTHLNRLERSRQGLPRRETALRLINALGLNPSDEQAQQLFEAAGIRQEFEQEEIPLHVSRETLEAKVRELKRSYFKTLDRINELEEMIKKLSQ